MQRFFLKTEEKKLVSKKAPALDETSLDFKTLIRSVFELLLTITGRELALHQLQRTN